MILEATYDIPKGAFSSIRKEILAHLAIPEGTQRRFLAEIDLEGIQKCLSNAPDPMKCYETRIHWGNAAFLAKVLTILPIQSDAMSETVQKERYNSPISPGNDKDYKLTLFGTHVTGIGPEPMTVLMRGYSSTGDRAFFLERFRKELEKLGRGSS